MRGNDVYEVIATQNWPWPILMGMRGTRSMLTNVATVTGEPATRATWRTDSVSRAWLTAVVVLSGWLALMAWVVPYDADEAIYKVVVTDVFDGHWPYEHLFINRQPLFFLAYAPAGLGASIQVQRLVAAAATIASVFPFATLARRLLSERQAVLAVWSFAALLANPYMITGANVEAFLLFPLLSAAVVRPAWLAGVLLGVALMLKVSVLPIVPAVLMIRAQNPGTAVVTMSATCAVCTLPFVPVWPDFWEANVTFNFAYNRYFRSELIGNLFGAHWGVVLGTLPVWIGALVGLAKERRAAIWMLAATSFIATKSTGLNFGHYYALLAPSAALLAGIGMVQLRGNARSIVWILVPSTLLAILIVAVGLFAFAIRDRDRFRQDWEELRAHPGELYVLGGHPEIYVYADRQPARRYFFSVPLVVNEHWGEETRADLIACPPDVLVVPAANEFQVDWVNDLVDVYASRREVDAGAIYTEPLTRCER